MAIIIWSFSFDVIINHYYYNYILGNWVIKPGYASNFF